jgi:hypothetical protein
LISSVPIGKGFKKKKNINGQINKLRAYVYIRRLLYEPMPTMSPKFGAIGLSIDEEIRITARDGPF